MDFPPALRRLLISVAWAEAKLGEAGVDANIGLA
jgi:hypothetical protein